MRIVAFGDFGCDHFLSFDRILPGGCSLNFAIQLKKSYPDLEVIAAGPTGEDAASDHVRQLLHRSAVVNRLEQEPGAAPAQYIETLPSGERRFCGWFAGVLEGYRPSDQTLALLADADVVCMPVFSQVFPLNHAVCGMKRRGRLVLDLMTLDDFGGDLDAVRWFMRRSELVYCGLSSGQTELIQTLESFALDDGIILVTTLGADGARVVAGGTRFSCPAPVVTKVVDTTGAGDAFAAGFAGAYFSGLGFHECLARGSHVAAAVLGHPGGVGQCGDANVD